MDMLFGTLSCNCMLHRQLSYPVKVCDSFSTCDVCGDVCGGMKCKAFNLTDILFKHFSIGTSHTNLTALGVWLVALRYSV